MTTRTARTWQEELSEECKKQKQAAPVFNIVSDRRGGRTAWSATVTVQGQNLAARYWYDGQYLNNAKEDAAEVACTRLRNPSINNPGRWSRNEASATSMSMDDEESGAAKEEEKVEPEDEPMPEGAIYKAGADNFD